MATNANGTVENALNGRGWVEMPNQTTVDIRFPHGLGDCVYLAQQIPLYQRRGFDLGFDVEPYLAEPA